MSILLPTSTRWVHHWDNRQEATHTEEEKRRGDTALGAGGTLGEQSVSQRRKETESRVPGRTLTPAKSKRVGREGWCATFSMWCVKHFYMGEVNVSLSAVWSTAVSGNTDTPFCTLVVKTPIYHNALFILLVFPVVHTNLGMSLI